MNQGPPKRRRLDGDAASPNGQHPNSWLNPSNTSSTSSTSSASSTPTPPLAGRLSPFPGQAMHHAPCQPAPALTGHPQAPHHGLATPQQLHHFTGHHVWPDQPAVSGNLASFPLMQFCQPLQAPFFHPPHAPLQAPPAFDVQNVPDTAEVDLSEWVQEDDPELVCFGRVAAIAGRWDHHDFGSRPAGRFPVRLLSSTAFALPDSGTACGKILAEHGQMVHGLLEEEALELHVSCAVDDDSTGAAAKRQTSRAAASRGCRLDITLYGPADLHDEIGSWFQEYEIYLQDPVECHRDVVYRNPQRLSAADPAACCLVSAFLLQSSQMSHLQDLPEQPDLLDILSSHVRLDEAEQPPAIRTALKSHQKKALTFMLQRELGWSFDRPEPDMWELVDTSQGRVFLNRISESHQTEEPPTFSGGIIADPMGLGKTLTMIALAATDLSSSQKEAAADVSWDDEDGKLPVPATLIVIPPPLIGSWEEQLAQHVADGQLQRRRHHGKDRLTSIDELRGVHVVLTSFHTVSAEWKAGQASADSQSVLFSVRWRRIILDEAHFIRNGNARMAKAVCALAAVSRWAVTGTPIQNRLGDLAALLAFVRAHPYTDPKIFDADISRLWKAGEAEKAADRLKALSTYLILRRPKATIELPARRDQLCPIDLAPAERELYDAIREQALSKIDEALQKDSESSRAGVYANALQKIESLRLVCDLGLHYHARAAGAAGGPASSSGSGSPSSEQEEWARNAQNVLNTQRDLGPMACLQCSSTLELSETLFDDAAAAAAPQQTTALLSRCLKFTCSDCTKKQRPSSARPLLACGHQPPCPTAPVSTSSAIWEETPDLAISTAPSWADAERLHMPSKIEALLADLRTLPPDTKCIVFSTWRLTLDIIKRGLDELCMESIRFDGKVPQKERQGVVDRFRADPSIRVMLLTLSCGAVGLNLTVATRAYLMEPHWNPTLEEQALARIHRLGQTREVTTVRFFVRDSFEEQVIKLQESKKQLASVLLSHHDTGQVDDNLDGLHKLRNLL